MKTAELLEMKEPELLKAIDDELERLFETGEIFKFVYREIEDSKDWDRPGSSTGIPADEIPAFHITDYDIYDGLDYVRMYAEANSECDGRFTAAVDERIELRGFEAIEIVDGKKKVLAVKDEYFFIAKMVFEISTEAVEHKNSVLIAYMRKPVNKKKRKKR